MNNNIYYEVNGIDTEQNGKRKKQGSRSRGAKGSSTRIMFGKYFHHPIASLSRDTEDTEGNSILFAGRQRQI